MFAGGARLGRLNAAGLMLAAMALIVRLAFPTGYMLAPATSELPTIVICTGQGAMTVALDAEGKAVQPGEHQDKSDAGKTSHPCTFSVAAAAFVAPMLVAIAAPVLAPQVVSPALGLTQRPGLGLAAPPPPKTGPPIQL